MKKTVSFLFIMSNIIFASTPIHNIINENSKGKSFGGTLDDNKAFKDGLGVFALQHKNGSQNINYELSIQKILTKVIKESDEEYTNEVVNNFENEIIGNSEDLSQYNKIVENLNNNTTTEISNKEINPPINMYIEGITEFGLSYTNCSFNNYQNEKDICESSGMRLPRNGEVLMYSDRTLGDTLYYGVITGIPECFESFQILENLYLDYNVVSSTTRGWSFAEKTDSWYFRCVK